eukprot:3616321-Rhodomonas_salina.1
MVWKAASSVVCAACDWNEGHHTVQTCKVREQCYHRGAIGLGVEELVALRLRLLFHSDYFTRQPVYKTRGQVRRGERNGAGVDPSRG